jgi:hypothetical protein
MKRDFRGLLILHFALFYSLQVCGLVQRTEAQHLCEARG